MEGEDLLEASQQLFVGAKGGRKEQVTDALVRRGVAVDTRDALGNTALHYAAGGGHAAAALALLEAGADVNATNAVGDTPLHKAAGRGQKDTAKLLVEWSADLYALNQLGQSPKDLASDAEVAAELVEQAPEELLEELDPTAAANAAVAADDEIPVVEVEPEARDPDAAQPQPRRVPPPPPTKK